LIDPSKVTNFDDDPSSSRQVTHKCLTLFAIEDHKFTTYKLVVCPLPIYTLVILGYDFQEMLTAVIDFGKRSIKLRAIRPGSSCN